MQNAVSNSMPLPLARQIACIVQNTCAGPVTPVSPATPVPKGDFDKLLKQAVLLEAAGYGSRDAAINGFFQALHASTTFDQASQILQALPAHGFAYRDISYAALSSATRRAETREQALTVAGAALAKGHAYDNWAVGALDRALAMSTKPAEFMEIANLAKDNEHLGHFRAVQERAAAKLR
ncbi:MAG: hypothetical protein JWM80_6663 [Cyanobacteria bacterium RYN_339]|nr:hypothetical protein [Cyanobacteria bacterium RYN_339]